MVKYLFEDNENADLSVLFRECVEDTSCIYYAYGNGKLKSVCNEIAKDNDFVIVFMDIVPDNRTTRKLYHDLRREFTKAGNCIIMPILCAEHLFLESIKDKPELFINYDETKRCLSGCNVADSEWLCELNKQKGFKKTSYEKYCKNIIRFNTSRACLNPASEDIKGSGYYYRNNCGCDNCAEQSQLQLKSLKYVVQYKVIPELKISQKIEKIGFEELFDIHDEMVENYNKFVLEYLNNLDLVSNVIHHFDRSLFDKERVTAMLEE